MLEIGFTYKGEENAFSWHVGDENPFEVFLRGVAISNVIQVEADGEELAHIRRCFTNLPGLDSTGSYANTKKMSWFGDHAKFIVYHLGRP